VSVSSLSKVVDHNRLLKLYSQIRDNLGPYEIYLSALLIFAVSRAVIFIGVYFRSLIIDRIPDPGQFDAGEAWYYALVRWDSGFYADIANHGYRYNADPTVMSSTAFYPLYPMLALGVKTLFGVDVFVALLLVANISAVAVALLLTKFVRDEFDEETALWSLAFFSFFPSSLFLSTGYTEATCLAFVLLSFIFLRQGKYVSASAFAGLSAATRSTGIVMLPVILCEIYRHKSSSWPRTLQRMALCGLLAVSGLLVFMAFLEIKFGNPLGFATSQGAWHNGTFTDRIVNALTLEPLRHLQLSDGGWFLCFLLLTIWSFWHLRFDASLYALCVLMLPYLTLGITGSMNRFVLMCFPAFVCAALLCRSRPLIAKVVVAILAVMLLLKSAWFAQWFWVG
jgi:hypothetical protein